MNHALYFLYYFTTKYVQSANSYFESLPSLLFQKMSSTSTGSNSSLLVVTHSANKRKLYDSLLENLLYSDSRKKIRRSSSINELNISSSLDYALNKPVTLRTIYNLYVFRTYVMPENSLLMNTGIDFTNNHFTFFDDNSNGNVVDDNQPNSNDNNTDNNMSDQILSENGMQHVNYTTRKRDPMETSGYWVRIMLAFPNYLKQTQQWRRISGNKAKLPIHLQTSPFSWKQLNFGECIKDAMFKAFFRINSLYARVHRGINLYCSSKVQHDKLRPLPKSKACSTRKAVYGNTEVEKEAYRRLLTVLHSYVVTQQHIFVCQSVLDSWFVLELQFDGDGHNSVNSDIDLKYYQNSGEASLLLSKDVEGYVPFHARVLNVWRCDQRDNNIIENKIKAGYPFESAEDTDEMRAQRELQNRFAVNFELNKPTPTDNRTASRMREQFQKNFIYTSLSDVEGHTSQDDDGEQFKSFYYNSSCTSKAKVFQLQTLHSDPFFKTASACIVNGVVSANGISVRIPRHYFGSLPKPNLLPSDPECTPFVDMQADLRWVWYQLQSPNRMQQFVHNAASESAYSKVCPYVMIDRFSQMRKGVWYPFCWLTEKSFLQFSIPFQQCLNHRTASVPVGDFALAVATPFNAYKSVNAAVVPVESPDDRPMSSTSKSSTKVINGQLFCEFNNFIDQCFIEAFTATHRRLSDALTQNLNECPAEILFVICTYCL
jgi:hypothetical protein